MDVHDFYHEKKFCLQCNNYVRYLMSVNHSYCVQCGSSVKMFSKEDAQLFSDEVQKRKWRVS